MRLALATVAVAAVCVNIWTATVQGGSVQDTLSKSTQLANGFGLHGDADSRHSKLESRKLAHTAAPIDFGEVEDEGDDELDLIARPLLFAAIHAQSNRVDDDTLISTRSSAALERPPRA